MTAVLTRLLDIVLQVATLTLIVGLTCVILLGVGFRYSGNSLIWYDEVAAVLLAWITFLGAALAGLRNAHLGFNGLLFGTPPKVRLALFWLGEAIFVAVFAVTAWAGWAILGIFGNETMTTLRFVPRTVVQGILPVSAALLVLGRLLTLPARRHDVVQGLDPEAQEIAHEVARAEADLQRKRPG